MTPTPFNAEMSGIQSRTRKTILVSGALHILLVLFLTMAHQITPGPVALTEITWIDPEELETAPPPPEVEKPAVEIQPLVAKAPETQRFERQQEEAEIQPEPQSDVSADRLAERLSALQEQASRSPAPALAVAATSPNVTLAAPSGAATPTARMELNRQAPPTRQPVALRREAPSATPVAAVVPKSPGASRAAPKAASTSSRNLAGATLVGEVADRRLMAYNTPKYPDWAKQEAVEGSVRLYFVVLRDGEIKKENVMVQKTSGYEDFDKNATKALLTWRFESLPPGQNGEQWGEITFNYRLSDGAGH